MQPVIVYESFFMNKGLYLSRILKVFPRNTDVFLIKSRLDWRKFHTVRCRRCKRKTLGYIFNVAIHFRLDSLYFFFIISLA